MKAATPKLCVTIILIVMSCSLFAQDKRSPTLGETKSEIVELTNFHEVIYKIWHTAWPEKDVAMLKDLLPDVERLGSELCKAKLPGILRERERAWKGEVVNLQGILAEYKSSVNGGKSEQSLAAAEKLHSQYEKMVRLVRPALKELEEFHSVLYPLYHYYMPQNDHEKISSSVKSLNLKFKALNGAVLPARLKAKEADFELARYNLGQSLVSLDTAILSTDDKMVQRKIEQMHNRYEELSRLFE
jgi:hypothetical protein